MYRMITQIRSVQSLRVSFCHVCTRAFLHVFYVSFVFVFFPRLYVLHIQYAVRLYVQRTCAGFLMSLFIVQSNDVFSCGIGSEKVIL